MSDQQIRKWALSYYKVNREVGSEEMIFEVLILHETILQNCSYVGFMIRTIRSDCEVFFQINMSLSTTLPCCRMKKTFCPNITTCKSHFAAIILAVFLLWRIIREKNSQKCARYASKRYKKLSLMASDPNKTCTFLLRSQESTVICNYLSYLTKAGEKESLFSFIPHFGSILMTRISHHGSFSVHWSFLKWSIVTAVVAVPPFSRHKASTCSFSAFAENCNGQPRTNGQILSQPLGRSFGAFTIMMRVIKGMLHYYYRSVLVRR